MVPISDSDEPVAGRSTTRLRFPSRALLPVLAAAVLFPVGAAPAQEADRPRPSPTGADPSARATRLEGSVEVDGRLAEPAWGSAGAVTGFVQGRPTEGAEPAQPTEVRVLYDREALYVGARMREPDPSAIAGQLVRRDERGQYDYFEMSLDPNLDRQTGYVFRVGVSGVERDAYVDDGQSRDFGGGDQGVNWDAVWESATAVDSAGWTVEMRIPLSQIRYASRPDAQAWGVNFTRRRLASNSTSFFALESRTVEGRVSQWGRLTGLRFREAERRFEVEPYAVTELASRPVDSDSPLRDPTELSPRVGFNVSYGVGSAFTLDATVNPDFGQVEVDPAVINLTAFETFFPEKRPFFVQDAQVLGFGLNSRRGELFFSRRIGREPRGEAPDDATFSSMPSRTTILGASKFTGRTDGGLSVGALAAVTAEEHGQAYFRGSGTTRDFLAQPRTQYGVGRVQQDLRDGATTVGAIVTGVNRSLPSDGPLADLPSEAFSGGIDFTHQWGGASDRNWSLSGYYAATHVRGSREAMVEVQTNPQHYFQRPDADYLSVDSTATHLTGANWMLEIARQSAEHWTWFFSTERLTPDLAANDLGFLDQGEQLDLTGSVAYQEIAPGDLFRSWSLRLISFAELRSDVFDEPASPGQWARSFKGGMVNLGGDFELLNNWSLSPEIRYHPRSLDETKTRGGPLVTGPASWSVGLRGNTDRRSTVSFEPNVQYTTREMDAGRSWQVGLGASLRPAPNWEIQVEPTLRDETDAAQYVGTVKDAGYGPTYGDRYLFADLERTQLSMETRLNVVFSPTVSLQLFAQPLISAVDFTSTKQLARPSSYDFRRFAEGEGVSGPEDVLCVGGETCEVDGERHVDFDGDGRPDHSFAEPSFNFRSLRGNAVFRWEYLPGSTLFLVWQQNRQGRAGVGDFDLGRDVDSLFGAPAENRFIVKVSHFLDV